MTGYRFTLDEADPYDDLPPPTPGEHLWVVGGLWHITEPESESHLLEAENLLILKGPGCYMCGEYWSPAVAAAPCPGEDE